jgi:peptide/nickel transport system permease protein
METTFEETTTIASTELEAPPLSLRELFWRRFRRHKMALAGAVMLILLILYATVGALFFTEAYGNITNTSIRLQAPSAEHPFGTDTVGRDLLARTIYGGQISLMIGLTAVELSLVIMGGG